MRMPLPSVSERFNANALFQQSGVGLTELYREEPVFARWTAFFQFPCNLLLLWLWVTIPLFLILLTPLPAMARVIADKTPSDVYSQALVLADGVRSLQKINQIDTPWPKAVIQVGRQPRHVFQKALEILAKINRYRSIHKLGSISTPRIMGRDITPNEVHTVVRRLVDEVALLLPKVKHAKNVIKKSDKSPNDVYQLLLEISTAIDPLLGGQEFSPSEVHARAIQILEMVRFIRNSQHLSDEVSQPERTQGLHPNHALEHSIKLLETIASSERNLWMTPVAVTSTPERVITPAEVYDSLHSVLGELQYIQFRLGLERYIETPEPLPGKTPDDVIQALKWSEQIMPRFTSDQPIIQFSHKHLKKTPNHVYSVSRHMLIRLDQYRQIRGIQVIPTEPPPTPGMQPRHVYQKVLEIMEKVNRLRHQASLGSIAVPRHPLREITPSEVFDAVIRLDEELAIAMEPAGMSKKLWITSTENQTFRDKKTSDVYRNLWRTSLLLDALLGSAGFTPNEVFREAQKILTEIELLAKYTDTHVLMDPSVRKPETETKDVFIYTQRLLKLVYRIQERAGMIDSQRISMPVSGEISSNDVFNQVRLILAELVALKVRLGITSEIIEPPQPKDKVPADILNILEKAGILLNVLLNGKHAVQGMN